MQISTPPDDVKNPRKVLRDRLFGAVSRNSHIWKRDADDFTQIALKLAKYKVAVIFPVARLNAAHWLTDAPLRRIWLMTPRPPMPPGSYLEAGHKPGGGRVDFAWLVFEHGYVGQAEVRWLRRDAR